MATLSGKKTVTAAGTAVQLSAGLVVNGPVMVKALGANTGKVYVGNVAGDVESTNGLELAAGEVVVFNQVGDLASIWLDAAVNGEGVTWICLEL